MTPAEIALARITPRARRRHGARQSRFRGDKLALAVVFCSALSTVHPAHALRSEVLDDFRDT
ncbi:MAG TPA: hypothetical protein VEZ89_04655, partial [Rubrivivax sp.]|nr:hypothetical protein [Rubrivivax sp.]